MALLCLHLKSKRCNYDDLSVLFISHLSLSLFLVLYFMFCWRIKKHRSPKDLSLLRPPFPSLSRETVTILSILRHTNSISQSWCIFLLVSSPKACSLVKVTETTIMRSYVIS
jgi:hypothetical protein